MNPASYSRRNLAICIAALIASTLLTYWPVLKNEFINYDDPDYVTTNDVVKQGLTAEGFKWAFTTGHASNWHPITWLSHMADVSMFGMNPAGHHATNLFFHTVNSVLLLLLLWLMTGSVWRSAMVAALFALHPLHVESVAWVAERKDVLSAFFGILTLMAYAHYVGEAKVSGLKSKVWYVAALGLFALGLMSKPMLVTWPFVMLLLDFWPLGRVKIEGGGWKIEDGKNILSAFIEKIPFFALTVGSCVVTLKVQQGAMSSIATLPLSDRISNSGVAYMAYLKQTLWPNKLAIFYPHGATSPESEIVLSFTALSGITLAAWILARRYPHLLTGWCWFLGTLIPVIGIVQVGGQSKADRYTYLPLIGIFILFAWGLKQLAEKSARHRMILVVTIGACLVAAAFATRQQLKYWRDSETLFTHTIEVTEGNYIAWAGLGIIEYRRDNFQRAIEHLERAEGMVPDGMVASQIRYYIGATKQKQGKGIEALPYFERSPEAGILQPERNYRLALSLIEAGRLDEAERWLTAACVAKPTSADFLLGKATLYHRRGRYDEADKAFQEILKNEPQNGLAQSLYANFLTMINRPEQAEASFAIAVKLSPNDVTLCQNRAINLTRLGRTKEALEQIQDCVQIQPENPELQGALAELMIQAGQTQKGIAIYEKLISQHPEHLSAINNLAWVLATHADGRIRNGKRAVDLAEKSCTLTGSNIPVLLGTLAAAYAECGRFEDAVATAKKARDLAVAQNMPDVARRNAELLEAYQSGKPAHD